MMQEAPASFDARDGEQQLFERRLRFDDERVGSGLDEGRRLFDERASDFVFGEVAIRFHQSAKRPDVTEHPALSTGKGSAGDLDSGPVDLGHLVGVTMAIEHDPRTAERVRDDAVGPGLSVAPLDGQHTLRVSQVPGLAATALLEPRHHELSAHRTIPEQRPVPDPVLQTSLHLDHLLPRASAK